MGRSTLHTQNYVEDGAEWLRARGGGLSVPDKSDERWCLLFRYAELQGAFESVLTVMCGPAVFPKAWCVSSTAHDLILATYEQIHWY